MVARWLPQFMVQVQCITGNPRLLTAKYKGCRAGKCPYVAFLILANGVKFRQTFRSKIGTFRAEPVFFCLTRCSFVRGYGPVAPPVHQIWASQVDPIQGWYLSVRPVVCSYGRPLPAKFELPRLIQSQVGTFRFYCSKEKSSILIRLLRLMHDSQPQTCV
jgi:hypothetical protein